MGEATYYLKAQFPTTESAMAIEPKFREWLKQMAEAQNAWQNIRDKSGTCAERRATLAQQFPLVSHIILFACDGTSEDKSMNCLAGKLDVTEDFSLTVADDLLALSDYVWHFADWDSICQWLKENGAIKAGWLSDEYEEIDYFDRISMS